MFLLFLIKKLSSEWICNKKLENFDLEVFTGLHTFFVGNRCFYLAANKMLKDKQKRTTKQYFNLIFLPWLYNEKLTKHWYKNVEQTGFKASSTIANTITINYRSILNYFINRSTNASTESLNAKMKAFRAQFREKM